MVRRIQYKKKVGERGKDKDPRYGSINTTFPIYSFGACRYWKKCGQIDVSLGNGLCIDCWDVGKPVKGTTNYL